MIHLSKNLFQTSSTWSIDCHRLIYLVVVRLYINLHQTFFLLSIVSYWTCMTIRMHRVDMICSTWIKSLVSVSFARRSLFTKIVLHGIISIVRFLTMQRKLDRLKNRDDDEKRSPLSVRDVAGFVFVTISRRRLMTVPFLPKKGEWRRWSHSERFLV